MIDQYKTLLLFRCKQVYRYLDEIGFGFILLALIITSGLILNTLDTLLQFTAYGAIELAWMILLMVEYRRNDKYFLQSIFNSKREVINYKAIENVFILFPILLFQGILLRWDIIFYLLITCIGISFFSAYIVRAQPKERKFNLQFIPLTLFEIKFFMEKYVLYFIFIFVLLALGTLHISVWLLGLFLLIGLPIEIYKPLEPREMLRYTKDFVRTKIIRGTVFFLGFISVPTLAVLLFHPNYYLLIIYGTVAMVLSTCLSISKKYTTYYGVTESIGSTYSSIVLILLLVIPGGILITLAACIYYYVKAENHMKNYYAEI
ncbi:MAG: hypothetical protein P1U56_18205 [Saprospiraceae bacterium]|nr:hypothetical protein [Saprospiraceae bacterium]